MWPTSCLPNPRNNRSLLMPSGTWCQVLSLWAARRRWNPIRIIAITATTSITMVAATPISSSSSPFIPRPRRHPGPPRTAHRGRPTGSGHHPHLAAGGPDRRGGELVVGQQFVGAGQRRTHRFRGHLTADGQRQKRSVVNSQAHGCALSVGRPGTTTNGRANRALRQKSCLRAC